MSGWPAHCWLACLAAIENAIRWPCMTVSQSPCTTLKAGNFACHCKDDIFNCIFLNENVSISLKIQLRFVPTVRINNIPVLVQIMAWHWSGNKPLYESMVVRLLMHICATRPQRVKYLLCHSVLSDHLKENSDTYLLQYFSFKFRGVTKYNSFSRFIYIYNARWLTVINF